MLCLTTKLKPVLPSNLFPISLKFPLTHLLHFYFSFMFYKFLSKKSQIFREEMKRERNDNIDMINNKSIPMGNGKSKPDKLSKKDGGRWSKTFGSQEEGTIGEAGTSDALAWRGC